MARCVTGLRRYVYLGGALNAHWAVVRYQGEVVVVMCIHCNCWHMIKRSSLLEDYDSDEFFTQAYSKLGDSISSTVIVASRVKQDLDQCPVGWIRKYL